MSKNSDSVKVVFGNGWTGFDGTTYEAGKAYDVSKPLSRHLLREGKVRIADGDKSVSTAKSAGPEKPANK